jgi:hypothetical protein
MIVEHICFKAFEFWRDKVAGLVSEKHEKRLFVEKQRLGLVQDGTCASCINRSELLPG